MSIIKIGSRKSQLAIKQTEAVIKKLKEHFPNDTFEIVGISTKGDRQLDKSLQSFGGKGVFIKEIETALLRKKTNKKNSLRVSLRSRRRAARVRGSVCTSLRFPLGAAQPRPLRSSASHWRLCSALGKSCCVEGLPCAVSVCSVESLS